MAAGGTLCPTQPDLGAAFQHGDHHGVGDAYATDQQRDSTQAKQQAGKGGLCGSLSGKRIGGPRYVHLVGPLRMDSTGEQSTNDLARSRIGPDVEHGDGAVEAEIALSGWPPYQRAEVEQRHEPYRLQDADNSEPLPAEPDLRVFMNGAKSQALGRPRPKHDGWVAGGCSIEPRAGDYGGTYRVQ